MRHLVVYSKCLLLGEKCYDLQDSSDKTRWNKVKPVGLFDCKVKNVRVVPPIKGKKIDSSPQESWPNSKRIGVEMEISVDIRLQEISNWICVQIQNARFSNISSLNPKIWLLTFKPSFHPRSYLLHSHLQTPRELRLKVPTHSIAHAIRLSKEFKIFHLKAERFYQSIKPVTDGLLRRCLNCRILRLEGDLKKNKALSEDLQYVTTLIPQRQIVTFIML